ncbi:MAG: hypothetical protein ABH862_03110, partial [Candidatus Omnitrophota bacterium]
DLHAIIVMGKRIPFKRFFKLGTDGYKWGLPFSEWFKLGYFGDMEPKEVAEIIYNSLTPEQMRSFQPGYDAWFDETHTSMQYSDWVKDEILSGIVAERWFTVGTIEIGGVSLPQEVLEFFPEEVFGAEHIGQYGARSNIVAKHLTSKVPLSLQLHSFDEMIIPLAEGEAWLGLKRDVTAEEFMQASREGKVDEVMNRVKLVPGQPMIVPAFMPHAYGEVNVYEVKAVTAEEDVTGTISFFDRFKFMPMLAELGLKTLAMTKEKLLELNPGRAKKDVLTMDEETLANTEKWLNEAERKGTLKKLDVSGLVFTPIETFKSHDQVMGTVKFEIMGETDRFVTGRYSVEKDLEIGIQNFLKDRFHTLFVTEGEVEITTGAGDVYNLKRGQKLPVIAAMNGYNIKATEGPAVIYTQAEALPGRVEKLTINKGQKVEGTETPKHKENVVFAQFPSGKSVASDEIEIVGTDAVAPPEVAVLREHTLTVTSGEVNVIFNGAEITLETGRSLEMEPNSLYSVQKAADKQATIRIDYDKTNAENDLYAVYDTINRNIPAMKEKKIDIFVPQTAFRGGGKGDVGSLAWCKDMTEKMLGEGYEIGIKPYDNSNFGKISTTTETGVVGVLIATEENLKSDETKQDVNLQNKLKGIRILPISGEDLDNAEISPALFVLKAVGTAVMQAQLNKEDISQNISIAQDTRTLMSQLANRSVVRNDLYYMLPYNDTASILSEMEEIFDGTVMSVMQFMDRLVDRLKLRPMEPLTPNLQQEIENRMKTLWAA